MRCYACGKPALEKCPACGRHYCTAHGDLTCNSCGAPARALPSQVFFAGVVALLVLALGLAAWYVSPWPDRSPSPSKSVAAAALGLKLPRRVPAPPITAASPTSSATAITTTIASATASTTPTPAPTSTPVPPQQYTVVAGDTLLGIAAKLDVTADELATANSISDPTTIQIGQRLTIPAKKQSPASAATPAAATAPVPASATPSSIPEQKQPIKHVVKPGETLIQIANSYGFTSGEVARFNGLSNTDQLRVGQELLIPLS